MVLLGISGIFGIVIVLIFGVFSGLGLGVWFGLVYVIVGLLDGLFDMGRIGVNVILGVVVVILVVKNEGLISFELNIFLVKLLVK